MINLQDFVKPTRTGKAGLRIASISTGSNDLILNPKRLSEPVFGPSDVLKNIVVIGAGPNGGNLYTTISAVKSSTEVLLAESASTGVSVAAVAWWDHAQDDTDGFNNAQKACVAGNGLLYCPGDVYIITSPLIALPHLQSMIGDGPGETFFVCTASVTGTFLTVPGPPSWFSLGGAPTQGFAILGPGYQQPATVTAWSAAGPVGTFSAPNNFVTGQRILLQGFTGTGNATVNNTFTSVLTADPVQFTADIPPADVTITDTGVASLDWNGIAFTGSGADWISLGNIEIQAFPGDAVQMNDTIVSDFRKVVMSNCGQGFNELASGTAAGTSLNFDTCFANGNYKAGYYLKSVAYSSFNNCAADHNGVAYYLDGVENISFNGSGSEAQRHNNPAYPGYSYYFHGAKRCALNCPYATSDNKSSALSTHLVFDNGANGIFVNCFKANSQPSAVLPAKIFTIDGSCSNITIWEPDFSSSGSAAWTDNGKRDTIYFNGQFQSGFATPKYTNSAPVSPAEFLLSAGWGDAAAINFASGSFAMGSFQIKANGSGIAANPTVTFTFPASEAGLHNPNMVWSRFDGSIAQAGSWLVSSISPTQIVWVFAGTPGAGENIGMQWMASSRG